MEATATRIVTFAREAIAMHGRFAWALSGGSTPRELYTLLATERFATSIDWRRVHFFWGDERCVPPDHPDSNYHMAHRALLHALPIAPPQVHRMPGEMAPEQAATNYERELREFFQTDDPRFDLVLLGMGADGHTASLFPHSGALGEATRWVVATRAPAGADRISLTIKAINAAAHVMIVVAGLDKSERVRQALTETTHALPVQRVLPQRGELSWMLDAQAAGGLP